MVRKAPAFVNKNLLNAERPPEGSFRSDIMGCSRIFWPVKRLRLREQSSVELLPEAERQTAGRSLR